MKRLNITVQGHVQGTSFRASAKETADVLGLTGRVRNQDDGSVRIIAEGPESSLKRLLDWAKEGPPTADVQTVEDVWRDEPTGAYDDFQVEL